MNSIFLVIEVVHYIVMFCFWQRCGRLVWGCVTVLFVEVMLSSLFVVGFGYVLTVCMRMLPIGQVNYQRFALFEL